MAGFFGVLGFLAIAIPFVIGVGVVTFVSTHLVAISVIFWSVILIITLCLLRACPELEEKRIPLAIPICILPTYLFIVKRALPEIGAMTGFFEPFLATCLELPMVVCFSLGVSMAIGWIGTRFRNPFVAVLLVLIGNGIFAGWMMQFGV